MTDQADMEARARAKWLMLKCVREADLDKQTLGDALADAMLAYSAEREAAAYARAAEVMKQRAAMYRTKAEQHDCFADDSLNRYECALSNAEASEWGASAIEALGEAKG